MDVFDLYDLIYEMGCTRHEIMLMDKDGQAVPLKECNLRKCDERMEVYIANNEKEGR